MVSQNFTATKLAGIPPGGTIYNATGVDPFAFFVGKVTTTITGNPQNVTAIELSPFIDRDAGTILSSTGELLWNYELGILYINASQVQGAVGFFNNVTHLLMI